jgi:hypothetical protein
VNLDILEALTSKLKAAFVTSMKTSKLNMNVLSNDAAVNFHFSVRDKADAILNDAAEELFGGIYNREVALNFVKLAWLKLETVFIASCRKLCVCQV